MMIAHRFHSRWRHRLALSSTAFVALAGGNAAVAAGSPGVDPHTVALWLFDEPTCPDVILTDASRYGYDLRLQSAYGAWALRTARYLAAGNVSPGGFLMVSRNGTTWTRYEEPYYFPGGWKLDGREVMEALMEHGMIRRGNEIWQYGTARFTEHAGALYGGKEEEGGGTHDRLLRLVQRLDGFVAVTPEDPARGTGTLVTKPLVFAGDHLELNVDAAGGSTRAELRDADGHAVSGFTFADCQPARENNTAAIVTWKSVRDLAALAGRPVRLAVELKDAKLYAFQFCPSPGVRSDPSP